VNLNAEAQMNWGAIVILMILTVSIAIIALRGLKEENQSSEESVSEEVEDTVISLKTANVSEVQEETTNDSTKKSGRPKKTES